MKLLPATRRGEALGWLLGWLGSLSWILALALWLTAHGAPWLGAVGGILFKLGLLLTWWLAPWRHPDTPYWRLLLPLYALLAAAVVWAISASGGWTASRLSYWEMLWLVPLFLPLVMLGKQRWHAPASD